MPLAMDTLYTDEATWTGQPSSTGLPIVVVESTEQGLETRKGACQTRRAGHHPPVLHGLPEVIWKTTTMNKKKGGA